MEIEYSVHTIHDVKNFVEIWTRRILLQHGSYLSLISVARPGL